MIKNSLKTITEELIKENKNYLFDFEIFIKLLKNFKKFKQLRYKLNSNNETKELEFNQLVSYLKNEEKRYPNTKFFINDINIVLEKISINNINSEKIKSVMAPLFKERDLLKKKYEDLEKKKDSLKKDLINKRNKIESNLNLTPLEKQSNESKEKINSILKTKYSSLFKEYMTITEKYNIEYKKWRQIIEKIKSPKEFELLANEENRFLYFELNKKLKEKDRNYDPKNLFNNLNKLSEEEIDLIHSITISFINDGQKFMSSFIKKFGPLD